MNAHLNFTGFTGIRLHLGVTGSVAAYKALDLLRMWQRCGLTVGATVTEAGQKFTPLINYRALGADPVYGAMYEEDAPVFGHLDPGRQAEALVIAPATANILAKLAGGIADDMLSAQALAFPGPKVLAPAMNPRMWAAPATQANWLKLKDMDFITVEPDSGHVACNEEGSGRLAFLEAIFMCGLKAVLPGDMAGQNVLVTMGPTRESWDAVRFWTNPSSGIQGAAIAVAAWLRGAQVTAVCGPGSPWLPDDVARIDVDSAQAMSEAVSDVSAEQDAICMCAAVADFKPTGGSASKFKKSGRTGLTIEFEPTTDILAGLGENKRPGQKLIGFAAETDDLETYAKGKLEAKNLDLIVANPLGTRGAGFASVTNKVTVMDSSGRMERWPELSKPEVAWRIWDWMLSL